MTLPGSLQGTPRLSRWVQFHGDASVTLTPGKVELGQGILTALRQIAAEELDVTPARIHLRPASTAGSPDEGVTSGSLSVQDCGTAVRHACAEARAIHLQVAAQRTGVPLDAIRVEDGAFLGPDGPCGSYWAQADDALLDVNATGAVPKPAAAHRIVGTPAPRLDLPDKVFGAPRFIHDLRMPGMLHARIVRPPARDASLATVPDVPAGCTLHRDGDFLAVVAADEATAERAAARMAARAGWTARDSLPNEAALADWLDTAPALHSVVAEAEAPLPDAAHTVRARFLRPFLAHGSIGLSCAIARWDGDAVEVWTHSQGVYNLRADLAVVLGRPVDAIVVHHREGAGCYGHNGADDVALDAALVARAHPGRPVRVQWSRAEELAWSPHSPAALVSIEASVDTMGHLRHWRSATRGNGHSGRPGRNADPTLLSAAHLAQPFPRPVASDPALAGGGGAQRNAVPIYRVPGLQVDMHRLTGMPIRTSALRGLGALVNVWAIESVMDELAKLTGADPVAFRLRHLDDPRAAAVLQAAAGMCGWPGTRHDGVGLGIAVARYKGTGAWCAVAAEIEATRVVRARRLWIAVDVGQVVNPDGVTNQIEGGAIQATSIALKEAVRFDRRTVTSDSWDSYPILRFSEVPAVTTQILSHPDQPPLGAGEPSMGPTIAAIAGAIQAALGVRPRAMPFTPDTLAALEP